MKLKNVIDLKGEAERLQSLQSYEILDTEPEKSFDDLTQLALEICKTPSSHISLVDKERCWFKSRIGFTNTEWPRSASICNQVIWQTELVEVSHLERDKDLSQRVKKTDAPLAPFYAAVPLIQEDGFCLGAFCVTDNKPRTLSACQKKSLKTLAHQTVTLLELRRKKIQLAAVIRPLANPSPTTAALAYQAKINNLTGRLAHEINNPLAIIGMLSAKIKSLSSRSGLEIEGIEESCDKINATVSRIGRIVKQIRSPEPGSFTDSVL